LPSSESWYDDPARWNVFLAQSGPASWPRVPIGDPSPPQHHVAKTHVTEVRETDNTVSFHVSKIGTPVLVKVSYFPNWQATGATGPATTTGAATTYPCQAKAGEAAANNNAKTAIARIMM